MKIRNFVKLIVMPLLFIFPLVTVLGSQQGSTITPTAKNSQGEQASSNASENAELNKAEAQERKCEMVAQRLGEKLETYRLAEEKHRGVYLGLSNKLTNLVNKLEEEGYTGENLDALKENITELDALTLKLKTSYTGLDANLQRARFAACGEDAQEYANAFQEARAALTDVRAVIKEIRDFYLTSVKTNIEAMRIQIREQRAAMQGSSSEEAEEATEIGE